MQDEKVNSDEREVEVMLGELPRAAAPSSFESAVRSRISMHGGSGWSSSPMLLLGLKFAAPVVILAVIGTFLILSGTRTPDTATVPPPADTMDPAATRSGNDAGITPQTEEAVQTEAAPGVVKPGSKKGLDARRGDIEGPGGGSKDLALSQDSARINPPEFDPNGRKDVQPVPPKGSGITAESILTMIGIKPECRADGCLASAVSKQSIAERSGVRAGDLIGSIDDKPIKSGTVFEGTVSVRSLGLRRGGKRMTVSLK